MNKNLKLKLIISSLAIFLPPVICIMFEEQLSRYLPYFSSGFDKKTMGFLTGFLLVLHLAAIYITYLDNKRKKQSEKMLNILFWIVPVISLFCNGISVMSFAEYDMNLLVGVFFGILFIIVGNYMPKCVQNRTVGIKIKWTLANEENWNKTHRFGGRAFVVGGILICISALLPVEIFIGAMLVIVLGVTVSTFLYSYLYYKKQLKNGSATKEDFKYKIGKGEKKLSVLGISLVVVLLVIAVVIAFFGEIEIEYGDDNFTVKADFYNDLTVKYADIEEIFFVEKDDAGMRVSGFATTKLLMGWFRNKEYGNYQRYTYTGDNGCVVLKINGKYVVVGCRELEQTRELYENILQRTKIVG